MPNNKKKMVKNGFTENVKSNIVIISVQSGFFTGLIRELSSKSAKPLKQSHNFLTNHAKIRR